MNPVGERMWGGGKEEGIKKEGADRPIPKGEENTRKASEKTKGTKGGGVNQGGKQKVVFAMPVD